MIYMCDDSITNALQIDRSLLMDYRAKMIQSPNIVPIFAIFRGPPENPNQTIRLRLQTKESLDFLVNNLDRVIFADLVTTRTEPSGELKEAVKFLINLGETTYNYRLRIPPESLKGTPFEPCVSFLHKKMPWSSYWINIATIHPPGYRWHLDEIALESEADRSEWIENVTFNFCLRGHTTSYAEVQNHETGKVYNSSKIRDKLFIFDPKVNWHRIVVESGKRDVMEIRSYNVTLDNLLYALKDSGTITKVEPDRDSR
jgi:hypothetical protein